MDTHLPAEWPARQPDAARKLRVLVASHNHPAYSNGGAEIAAFQIYSALAGRHDSEAWFLGCGRDQMHARLGSAIAQPFSEREFLYASGEFEWFKFANRDPRFPSEFATLLREIEPDILHLHHYINFGVEVCQIAKRVAPGLRIVLTLHEYLAICHHFGQMITREKQTLCYEASAAACSKCFPDQGVADFFLRETYAKSFLGLVDHFIAPSRFLAERYIAWGLPAERMSVVENVIATRPPPDAAPRRADGDPLRVAFFGQISRLKGINVLLEAAQLLEREEREDVVFEIYGDYRGQPPAFQEEFLERLAGAGRNVMFHGPYDNRHVDRLMRGTDVVLVPSIWWENSPVVIQEAFRNRRPVLCSDIGGMAEKVRDGLDGYHFRAGSTASLASLVRRLAADRTMLDALAGTIQSPPSAAEVTERHLAIFRDVLAPAA